MCGKSNKQSKPEVRQLPANYKLGRFDVICARGKLAQEHEGNIRMKALVQSCLPQYSQTSCKVTKSRIVSSVVDCVRQASPEGGFVKFVDDGWVCVNDRFSREKVGQQFRDLLHTKYRSSTKAKARARMQQTGSPTNLANNSQFPIPPLTGSAPGPITGPSMLNNFKNQAEPGLVPSGNDHSLAAQLSLVQQPQFMPVPVGSSSSSNFWGQLIQSFDTNSSRGTHTDLEKLLAPASSTLPASSADPHADLLAMPTAGPTAVPSELEPTPLREEHRNPAATFSVDAFLW